MPANELHLVLHRPIPVRLPLLRRQWLRPCRPLGGTSCRGGSGGSELAAGGKMGLRGGPSTAFYSSACARRTGVLRTYREVVVMLA
jgi:hypothetical protein